MMTALQLALWCVGLSLQSLLLVAMAQGAGKQFPALVAYLICLLITTTADIVAFVFLGKSSSSFATYYWSAELVRQSALFALVVSLAVHAIPRGRKEEAYSRLFTFVAIAIWAGSILAYYDTVFDTWMTSVVRNFSFFTGILNLFVWFTYARSNARDNTRLMIAAGLGLQMTGEAIGQAIRLLNLSRKTDLVGALFIVLSHLLCLFIWWRAFRTDLAFFHRAPNVEVN